MNSSTAANVGVQRTIQQTSSSYSSVIQAAAAGATVAEQTHFGSQIADEQLRQGGAAAVTGPSNAEDSMQAEDDDGFMDWETRADHIPIEKHIIAGSCAGIMEHVAMYPMDTIKTHIQASGRTHAIRDIALILYREEGLFRFWKGAQVVASGCVPAHASYYLTYEHLKRKLGVTNDEFSFFATLQIGALTTFAHDFFITPAELIKQRLQLCKNLTAFQCLKDILRDEGLRGLYRSYPLTVMMNIPFASCVICVNENLKTIVRPWERQYPYFWYFFCAGIAGGVAGIITNPLDVVKTRLQTQEVQPSCESLRKLWTADKNNVKGDLHCCEMPQGANHPECGFEVRSTRYVDFRSTAQYIFRNEGLGAFAKGVLPRMSINVPAAALSWSTYEMMKSLLNTEGD